MKNFDFVVTVALIFLTKKSTAVELIDAPCGTFDCSDTYYEPVCAVYQNGTQQTFKSPCFASIGPSCFGIKYYEITSGVCSEGCQRKCPKDYTPICTEDSEGNQQTYANDCKGLVAVCKNEHAGKPTIRKVHEGECKNDECSVLCPELIAPIYVEDSSGKCHEFDNQCILNVASCRKEIDVIRISASSCSPECPEDCPEEAAPVCGEDSEGNQETFTNTCIMKQAVCRRNLKIVKIYQDECVDGCSMACDLEYDPLCVETSDGNFITFQNECELESAQCRKSIDYIPITDGECFDSCAVMCPKIYQPVCAEDEEGFKQSYSNICDSNVAECGRNKKYKHVRDGPC